ncbi:ergothioneine biosynthesis protein EgtB, partial [Xanthomonas vasicola]
MRDGAGSNRGEWEACWTEKAMTFQQLTAGCHAADTARSRALPKHMGMSALSPLLGHHQQQQLTLLERYAQTRALS